MQLFCASTNITKTFVYVFIKGLKILNSVRPATDLQTCFVNHSCQACLIVCRPYFMFLEVWQHAWSFSMCQKMCSFTNLMFDKQIYHVQCQISNQFQKHILSSVAGLRVNVKSLWFLNSYIMFQNICRLIPRLRKIWK